MSEIRTISLSPLMAKIVKERDISLSKAIRSGIALSLAMQDDSFPFTELEEAIYNDSLLPAYKVKLSIKIASIYGNSGQQTKN